ncbi:DNA-directed RNA polymerases I and III subunit RPAC2-like [Watersipora subatra]|uniref:DNA-directed RNA polymerases I and III subunit RPAC2-like n=1 Tax=Watersipora subatra TaxID=2589382 RepID=UPI00355C7CB2
MSGDKSDTGVKAGEEKVKIEEIRPNEDDESQSCRTFVLHEEDHTLGNALRYVIMKDPRVEVCGYSVPHPSEDKILLRIQTDTTCSAEDALRTGVDNLQSLSELILKKFDKAIEKHKQRLS